MLHLTIWHFCALLGGFVSAHVWYLYNELLISCYQRTRGAGIVWDSFQYGCKKMKVYSYLLGLSVNYVDQLKSGTLPDTGRSLRYTLGNGYGTFRANHG